jgi:hypothetical protein
VILIIGNPIIVLTKIIPTCQTKTIVTPEKNDVLDSIAAIEQLLTAKTAIPIIESL